MTKTLKTGKKRNMRFNAELHRFKNTVTGFHSHTEQIHCVLLHEHRISTLLLQNMQNISVWTLPKYFCLLQEKLQILTTHLRWAMWNCQVYHSPSMLECMHTQAGRCHSLKHWLTHLATHSMTHPVCVLLCSRQFVYGNNSSQVKSSQMY